MTSIPSKTWSYGILAALAASALASCTSPSPTGATPPPLPAGDGKADGPCPYSCGAYHYAPGQCLDGWECDAAGTCLSYVGTPDAPDACPATPPVPPMPTQPAVGVQQVATGLDYSCVLKLDGTIACWGDDGNANWDWTGRTHPPSGTFRQIALAEDHACAIRSDGTAACWGGNGAADSVFPPSGTFKELSADSWATCGIRDDGTITCWGSAYQSAENGFAPFAHVSMGAGSGGVVCGLTTAGVVYCEDALKDALEATPMFPDVLTAISVNGQSREDSGQYDACGLRSDGTMMCWEPWVGTCDDPGGFTVSPCWQPNITNCGVGQDGALECLSQAHAPNGLFKAISVGQIALSIEETDPTAEPSPYVCAIRDSGQLACMARSGQVAPPAGTFIQLSAGPTHACAVRDDHTVVCWGTGAGATVPANL